LGKAMPLEASRGYVRGYEYKVQNKHVFAMM
jgi:hypothetical protein